MNGGTELDLHESDSERASEREREGEQESEREQAAAVASAVRAQDPPARCARCAPRSQSRSERGWGESLSTGNLRNEEGGGGGMEASVVSPTQNMSLPPEVRVKECPQSSLAGAGSESRTSEPRLPFQLFTGPGARSGRGKSTPATSSYAQHKTVTLGIGYTRHIGKISCIQCTIPERASRPPRPFSEPSERPRSRRRIRRRGGGGGRRRRDGLQAEEARGVGGGGGGDLGLGPPVAGGQGAQHRHQVRRLVPPPRACRPARNRCGAIYSDETIYSDNCCIGSAPLPAGEESMRARVAAEWPCAARLGDGGGPCVWEAR